MRQIAAEIEAKRKEEEALQQMLFELYEVQSQASILSFALCCMRLNRRLATAAAILYFCDSAGCLFRDPRLDFMGVTTLTSL